MSDVRLQRDEMCLFARELALILKAGIPLNSGISTIYEENPKENAYVKEIENQLLEGSTFSDALKHTGIFDPYFISMASVGEESGNLDNVMEALGNYYERMQDIRDKMKEVLFYPLMLGIMMLVVIGVIVIKVLPIFQDSLRSIGADLSPAASFMMDVGIMLGTYGFYILLILAGLLALFIVIRMRKKDGKDTLEKFLPASLSQTISTAKLSYAMSLLLSSGYDTDQMFSMLETLIQDELTKKKLKECRTMMSEGISVEEAMLKSHLYHGLYERMIYIGFKSGSGEAVMKQAAGLYENDIDKAVVHFLNRMEPLIVAVCSIIIGIVLLSVMLPLLSIMKVI